MERTVMHICSSFPIHGNYIWPPAEWATLQSLQATLILHLLLRRWALWHRQHGLRDRPREGVSHGLWWERSRCDPGNKKPSCSHLMGKDIINSIEQQLTSVTLCWLNKQDLMEHYQNLLWQNNTKKQTRRSQSWLKVSSKPDSKSHITI